MIGVALTINSDQVEVITEFMCVGMNFVVPKRSFNLSFHRRNRSWGCCLVHYFWVDHLLSPLLFRRMRNNCYLEASPRTIHPSTNHVHRSKEAKDSFWLSLRDKQSLLSSLPIHLDPCVYSLLSEPPSSLRFQAQGLCFIRPLYELSLVEQNIVNLFL